jgi:hypothetical protein
MSMQRLPIPAGGAPCLDRSDSSEAVLALVMVRPLAEDEETFRATYRTKLPALYRKLKG